MPFFSIVIPTRNRAHLLPYALQSALEQEFDDLEIIVSDNYSDDKTAEVVKHYDDSRIRYVRTDQALSMPDSWEFALSKTKGDYICFLCDDDAISPRLVRTVANIIVNNRYELVCWKRCNYYHSSWYQPELGNTLFLTNCSMGVAERESRPSIISLCKKLSIDEGSPGPLMLNSACSRGTVDKVKKKIGRFFLPPAPDYSSFVALLAVTDRYAFIDDVLVLGGCGKESIGASSGYQGRSEAVRNYQNEFKDRELMKYTPLHCLVVANTIAESFLRVKHALPEELDGIDIEWKNYFVSCYQQLMVWKDNGTEISADLEGFKGALSNMPFRFQFGVLLGIWKSVISPKRLIQKVVRMNPIVRRQAREFYWRIKSVNVVKGTDFGFGNILECARKLDDIQKRCSPMV